MDQTTNLGTRLIFEVVSHPVRGDVYTINLPRKDVGGSWKVPYRISPEDFRNPARGWRIDEHDMMAWVAVTPKVFKTAEAAAKAFVKMIPSLSMSETLRKRLSEEDGLAASREQIKKFTVDNPQMILFRLETIVSLTKSGKGVPEYIAMDLQDYSERMSERLTMMLRNYPWFKRDLEARMPDFMRVVKASEAIGEVLRRLVEENRPTHQERSVVYFNRDTLSGWAPQAAKLAKLYAKTVAPLGKALEPRFKG